MTKHEHPWIVGLATLLAMVSNATVAGFSQSVYRDGLALRIPSSTQLGEQEKIKGDELFANYKHYCIDYTEEVGDGRT